MIDFNYKKDKKYIPLPLCVDDETTEKSCFIDSNRISNISVVSNSSFFNASIGKKPESSVKK